MKKPALIILGVLAIGVGFVIADTISGPGTNAAAPRIDFTSNVPAKGSFPKKWIHGSESLRDNEDPPLQVHWYNDNTVILRENKAYNYEGCFLHILFGNDRAILWDQGSTSLRTEWPLRDVVDGVIAEWCKRNGREDIPLVVANTHLHGDHYAGWNQFVDRPNTTMVGLTHEEIMTFFGFTNYPEQQIEFDLGGRSLKIWGSPGHEASELSFYDPYTQLLCTGDMFYRGRLYIYDFKVWFASIERLVKFADTHPISHIIANHIEMSAKAGVDYPYATTYQPDEPPMDMDVGLLYKTYEFCKNIKRPGIYTMDEFLVYNEVPWSTTTEKLRKF
jgi:glyoxylase-like metal-dependent hydrolase (beta-lactamase superfamily II)